MLTLIFALALAAQADASASTSAPPATPVASAPAKPETAAQRRARERAIAEARIECREWAFTGSNLAKTVCVPVSEWNRMREESRAEARMLNDAVRESLGRR